MAATTPRGPGLAAGALAVLAGIAACTPAEPSPTGGPVAIAVVGDPELVYSWAEDRCEDGMLADLPPRVIRAADGTYSLYLASATTYRLTGDSLDGLEPDCDPVFSSTFDRDASHYNHTEWIAAPYTEDGERVVAIVHQEYHGDQAGAVWAGDVDFSGTQGSGGWTYVARTAAGRAAMTYDAVLERWVGPIQYCEIAARGMHPGEGCVPERTWTSPYAGEVTVFGRALDLAADGGDGVVARVTVNDAIVWEYTIENGDELGRAFELPLDVVEGDEVRFTVDARGDAGWDSTSFPVGINIGPQPCPSGNHALCTLISLTYAESNDGGAHFDQAAPPRTVAVEPYVYDPEAMRALWQPSNIVRDPRDGYYYALVQRDEHADGYTVNLQGTCAMRTTDPGDPSLWRGWGGEDWDVEFASPYVDPDLDPAPHTCALVGPENGALTYSLTYNTFLGRYVALGAAGGAVPGFYFSTSEDLVAWTPKQLLLEAAMGFANGGVIPYYAYPALIDPASSAPSFDTMGRTGYLYYVVFVGDAPWATDVYRVPVEVSG